jgi:DNA-binding response OmpR family regulator
MKKKILIIEDEKELRLLLGQALSEDGFQVEGAMTGEEAMKKIKEGLRPDLILLDLLLPGIGGYEFLVKIKKDAAYESIPVIIISNLGQEEEIKKGLQMGAEDYYIKAHFTLQEMIGKINKFFE